MTDITELAQRMRIAATMASQGAWSYARSGFNSIVRTSANLPSGGASRVVLCKLFRSEWRGELKTAQDAQFIAMANPANILALVEALEKSEKTSEARREAIDRTHNMFVRERDRANAAEEALEKAQQRIAELEEAEQKLCAANVTLDARAELAERQLQSSTVRLPKEHSATEFLSPVAVYPAQELTAALTAQGIKVEAE